MATRDPERYFDRRTITRHLKRGHVSEGEFSTYVETLPDVSDKIKPRDEGGDDDGFDGRGKPKSPSDGKGVGTSLLAQFGGRPVISDDDDDDDDYDDDYDDDDAVSEGTQAEVAQAPSEAQPVQAAAQPAPAPAVAQPAPAVAPPAPAVAPPAPAVDTHAGVESVPADRQTGVESVPAVDTSGAVESVPAGTRNDIESASGSSGADIESVSDTRGDNDRGDVQP